MTNGQVFDVHLCLGRHEGAALTATLAGCGETSAARASGHPCLGGCGGRVRASLAAHGCWSWLFGDLTPDHAAGFARFAAIRATEPAAAVPKPMRPAGLRQNIIGRLPPPMDSEAS